MEHSGFSFNFNLFAVVFHVLVLFASGASVSAQTFNTLYSFSGPDGDNSQAPLIQGFDGNFYGTTVYGGAEDTGTAFRITPSGGLMTLVSFYGARGVNPWPGLVQGTDGAFYGATNWGGADRVGTLFKLSGHALTQLHSFNNTDGYNPQGGLIQSGHKDLYGTTLWGGLYGGGSVYKITRDGALTTLHSFAGAEGANPYAPVIQASDDNFYGTAWDGGDGNGGTVFKMTPSGTMNAIYSFCVAGVPCADGTKPVTGLVQGIDGNFYGATAGGGDGPCGFSFDPGCGTVFKVTPRGALITIHQFQGPDGSSPYSDPALVEGTDGNFYGTTPYGGANDSCDMGCGTVFSISPDGVFTTLYNFCSESGCTDGATPVAGLIQGTDGAFYGTTASGGSNGLGTIFRMSVGLGPFVKTNPAAGKVGDSIRILGTNLTGATGVTFNGTAATFVVVSGSQITTNVPTGATTGSVQVITPSGTLTSNIVFRVR